MAVREEMARVATKWWADILRVDQVPSLVKHAGWGHVPEEHKEKMTPGERLNQAQEIRNGSMGDLMMGMLLANAERLKEEEIDAFEEALVRIIVTKEAYGGYCYLRTDYGPEQILVDALEASGIDLEKTRAAARFPFKTDMRITDEYVSVSAGYRAEERAVIRNLVCAREWPVFKPWYDEDHRLADPLCKIRGEILAKHNRNFDHPEYKAAHEAVIAAMEPRKQRDEHWRLVRDHIIDALPLMPGGKIENIVNDIWLTIVASDEAYMADRAKHAAKVEEDAVVAALTIELPKKLPRKLKKKLKKQATA